MVFERIAGAAKIVGEKAEKADNAPEEDEKEDSKVES